MKLSCIQLAIPFKKVVQNNWITICHPSFLKGQQNLPLGNCRKSVDWPGPNISQHRHRGTCLLVPSSWPPRRVVLALWWSWRWWDYLSATRWGPNLGGSSHLVSKYFATMELYGVPLITGVVGSLPHSLVMAYTYRGYTSYLLRKGDPPSTSCT